MAVEVEHSILDPGGVLKASFDDETQRLKVELGDGNYDLVVNPDGSINTITSLVVENIEIGKVDQGLGGTSAWKVDGSAVTQPISAVSLPLPTLAATSTNQTSELTKLDTLHTDLGVIESKQDTGNSSLSEIALDTDHLDANLSTLATSANQTTIITDLGTINTSIGITNTDISKLTITQGTTLGSNTVVLNGGSVTTVSPTYTTGQINPLSLTTAGALRTDASATIQPVSGTVTANAGTGNFTVVQATGTNLHTVVDSGSIAATQSGTWNITNISGIVSLPTGASTSDLQITGNNSLSSIDSKLFDNYGITSGALRTASQIGNTNGQADFNVGTSGAQTLRVSSNITRNGTELSYNDGTSDVNTIRTSSNLKRQGNDLDYNYGTVGTNTLRTASEVGNSTGAADFNAGTTGAQTQRVSSNITHNGTELSYNSGAIDANTIRTAAIIGNAAGVIDYNYGTVGTQTIRSAAQIGNATGAADFNTGATGAQTLRVIANQGIANSTPWNENIAQIAGTNTVTAGISGLLAVGGNIASGSTDSGNPLKVGAIFNTILPTITNGQRVDNQADNNGRLIVAAVPLDGAKATYSACITNLIIPAAATDVFTITGSASKTIRITKIIISGSQTTRSYADVVILKRSTANSAGTSTIPTAVSYDSSDAAATATVRAYTVNPTTGTLVGNFLVSHIPFGLTTPTNAQSNGSLEVFSLTFSDRATKAIVVRGTSEVVAINFNGQTLTAPRIDISIEWTEE